MTQKEHSILELNIEDFRAIKKANIKLDGITVVTGENGCGKSTLSKLLYYSIKISKQYDDFLKKKLIDDLEKLTSLFLTLRHNHNKKNGHKNHLYRHVHYFLNKQIENKNIDVIQNKDTIISIIEKWLQDISKNHKEIDKREFYRFNRMFLEDFKEYYQDINIKNEKIELENLTEIIKKTIENLYQKIEEEIKRRDKKLFETKLKNIYQEDLKHFSIYEYSVPIISHDLEEINSFEAIDHAIYFDTPMAVENEGYKYKYWISRKSNIDKLSHWTDLDYYLKNKNKPQVEEMRNDDIHQEIKELFSSPEILNGEISLDDDELIFTRKDKKRFKVLDCATGVKSLAVLQMLHANGWLTNKTLLILDEPESHLHPQWVVEYARLIVLLNKTIGVKFFISSHHPDMISAMRDICDKENQNDKLKFYLAKNESKSHQYNFVDEGIDIENIFDSFNIAIERINKYGGDDE